MKHTDEDGIRELLMGRTVIKVNEESILLDDGTLLTIQGNSGCGGCSAGNYELTELNECPNNMIMNVEFECEDDDYGQSVYRVFVYAEDTRIKLLEVEGEDGNGWYGTGYWIEVKR